MGENAGMSDDPAPIRRKDAPDVIVIDGAVAAPQEQPRAAGDLATLLESAGPDGDHGTVHSGDGLFLASIPLDRLRQAALSDEFRLIVPETPTKCWLVKDVRRIEITHGRQPDSLPPEEQAKT